MSKPQTLAQRIHAYCRAGDISTSLFGRVVARDVNLYPQVKRGRQPGPALMARIEKALTSPPALITEQDAAIRSREAKAKRAASVAAMLQTAAANRAQDSAALDVPNNPQVCNFGGAYQCTGGEVMIDVAGTRAFLRPEQAEQLAARLVALAALAKQDRRAA